MIDERLRNYWLEAVLNSEFHAYDPTLASLRVRIHNDVPSFMEMPIAWKAEELAGSDAVFLGFPWEGFVQTGSGWATCGPRQVDPEALPGGRTGAYDAPDYIRKCSIAFALHASGGYYPEVAPDFRLADHLVLTDYRNVDVDEWDVDIAAQRAIEKVGDIVKAGAVPMIFGGDHSTPYPVVRGISDNSEGKIGIILIDRHYDNAYGGEIPRPLGDMGRLNASNAFYKIFDTCQAEPENFVTIGIRGETYNTLPMHELAEKIGSTVFTAGDVERMGMTEVINRAVEVATRGTDKVYVSLDVDAIDPVSFPAQKYPDPFGLTARDVREALRVISRETNLAGFDMVCMGPAYDVNAVGGMTACRFYIELLTGLALRKSKQSK
jgi:arginase family enzyme